jgi:hypothetical protein
VALLCGICPNRRVLAWFTLDASGRVLGTIGPRRLQSVRSVSPGVGVPVWGQRGEEHLVWTLKGASPVRWQRYQCDKCGKRWPRSREQVERAVLKAIEDHRDRIVAGVHL